MSDVRQKGTRDPAITTDDEEDYEEYTTVATEFVTEAFEIEIPDGAVESLATIIENAVRELRANVASDDRLETLLRGEDVLRERDSVEQEDPDERQRLQAEIDAAAFHAYGLDREETNFVLDDFHRVRGPRMMTEEYFDLVAEKYDGLAE